ncbi:hypothetical protein ACWDTI_20795 [Gordonia sp. NPDC003424]
MAELDHDDRPEVTDPDPGGDTTHDDDHACEPVIAARTPVRSAPLGRGRRPKPRAASASDAGTPDAGSPEARTPVAGTPETGTPEAGTPEGTAPETTAAETRDPSDVEQTLSYRERRRARMAASAGAPEPSAEQRRAPEASPAPPDDATKRGPTSRVRYAGRSGRSARWLIAGGIGVVIIIACVAAAIAFAVGISRHDRQNDLRAEYSAFAGQMIVNLTTLNPGNVDQAMKTMETKTSGRAQQQMQDSMRQAVGLVQDQKVDTKSTIISSAVTKATPDEGTVILVSGWQMKSPDAKEGTTVQTFRWRVQLTRINGELKMTNFEWVT